MCVDAVDESESFEFTTFRRALFVNLKVHQYSTPNTPRNNAYFPFVLFLVMVELGAYVKDVVTRYQNINRVSGTLIVILVISQRGFDSLRQFSMGGQ